MMCLTPPLGALFPFRMQCHKCQCVLIIDYGILCQDGWSLASLCLLITGLGWICYIYLPCPTSLFKNSLHNVTYAYIYISSLSHFPPSHLLYSVLSLFSLPPQECIKRRKITFFIEQMARIQSKHTQSAIEKQNSV